MKSSPLSLVLLLSLLAASLSLSAAQTIVQAAIILSDSGYKSMARSLYLAADSLDSNPTSLTIFAPSDDAFAAAGQPSLDLLRLHLLPVDFPLRSLKSLPYGTKIATLLDEGSLTVTTLPSDDDAGAISLNNVTVAGAPIYDDGSLMIYSVDRFFSCYKIRGCLAPSQTPPQAQSPPQSQAVVGRARSALEAAHCPPVCPGNSSWLSDDLRWLIVYISSKLLELVYALVLVRVLGRRELEGQPLVEWIALFFGFVQAEAPPPQNAVLPQQQAMQIAAQIIGLVTAQLAQQQLVAQPGNLPAVPEAEAGAEAEAGVEAEAGGEEEAGGEGEAG